MMNDFAKVLKVLRARKNMTQAAVAEYLKVPKRTYEAWEGGTRVPPPWSQELILRAIAGMYNEDLIGTAAMVACMAHAGQLDKGGNSYILHPFAVASKMHTDEEIMTALLHDVVEDTPWTLEDLQKLGFPDTVLEAVKVLTHDKKEPYLSYIEKVKLNSLARRVKMADLAHNMDLKRINAPGPIDLARIDEYKAAMKILSPD